MKYRNVKGNQLREKSTEDIKEWKGRGERRKAVKAKQSEPVRTHAHVATLLKDLQLSGYRTSWHIKMRRQKPAARARSTLNAKKRNGINPKSMKSETRPRIAQQRGRVVANQRAAPERRVQRVPSESGQWTESAQRAATAATKEPDTKKKATRRCGMEWSVSGVWRLEWRRQREWSNR